MNIYDFTVLDLNKKPISLSDYKGQTLLVVNTATECGLADQMNGLEALHRTYHEKGFSVLGFPSNQFMGQEPLNGTAIKEHCQLTYGTTFPLFDKIEVNGSSAHELYKHLVKKTRNKAIKWNYTKFLIGPDGEIVKRYSPITTPDAIESDIVKALPNS